MGRRQDYPVVDDGAGARILHFTGEDIPESDPDDPRERAYPVVIVSLDLGQAAPLPVHHFSRIDIVEGVGHQRTTHVALEAARKTRNSAISKIISFPIF
jgi:hypothetical protein